MLNSKNVHKNINAFLKYIESSQHGVKTEKIHANVYKK